ncbi:hypothetical protein [Verrucomicrobium sp. BvORR106]|uniref:hypothetical protein n=1 Tax=Verrucomicrobium sp. BvORR106 TaxID=1403819 RepID=UPI000571B707|nr:hypothetical protein [Verrucomicrobium sp. BvORR106]
MSLEGLKEGDKVLVLSRYGSAVRTVGRVTKRHAMVADRSFRLRDGLPTGESFVALRIQRATPEDILKHEVDAHRRALVATLKGTDWDKLTVETLQAVQRMIAPRLAKAGKGGAA